MGSVTIAQALGVPFPVLAAGVVLMAVGCFLGAEKLETIFAPKANKPVPASQPAVRNRAFAAMGALAVVGLVTVALPARQTAVAEKPLAKIGAVELAQKIVAAPQELWILDLRDAKAAPATERIPGTMTLPEGTTAAQVRRHAPRHPDARRLRAGRRGELFPRVSAPSPAKSSSFPAASTPGRAPSSPRPSPRPSPPPSSSRSSA